MVVGTIITKTEIFSKFNRGFSLCVCVFLNRRIPVDKRFNEIDDKIRQLYALTSTTAGLESRKNAINTRRKHSQTTRAVVYYK